MFSMVFEEVSPSHTKSLRVSGENNESSVLKPVQSIKDTESKECTLSHIYESRGVHPQHFLLRNVRPTYLVTDGVSVCVFNYYTKEERVFLLLRIQKVP